MFQFDERFLESVGLSAMSEEQKEAFLDYAQEQFETKIGEAMSARLSEEQLNTFDNIIDGDQETVGSIIAGLGDFSSDADYRRISSNSSDENEAIINFAMKKWLDQNCPDYDNLIQNVLANLQKEIYEQRNNILAV